MNSSTTAQSMVTLNVPPSQEEAVVDWLLSRRGDIGFTSQIAFGHSANNDKLSPAEQVSGRRRRLQFLIQMPSVSVDDFLREGRGRFGSANSYYWVLPMTSGGPLDQVEETQ